MPSVFIPRIGAVEYTRTVLPEGIKGKSKIGALDFPILISEDLEPGTKLEYIVSHEVGHRLTLDMIINANREMPELFAKAPTLTAGLVRYFITLGLTRSAMNPKHPGTKNVIDKIFLDNSQGRWTDDLTAREFIAEVYANWAINTGHIPRTISERFEALTESKNILLSGLRGKLESEEGQEAAFQITADKDAQTALIFVGIVVLAVVLLR